MTGESISESAMDIGTALESFLFSKAITSFGALDQALTELDAAINTEQCGVEHIIQPLLLDQDLFLFETVMVSRGSLPVSRFKLVAD